MAGNKNEMKLFLSEEIFVDLCLLPRSIGDCPKIVDYFCWSGWEHFKAIEEEWRAKHIRLTSSLREKPFELDLLPNREQEKCSGAAR